MLNAYSNSSTLAALMPNDVTDSDAWEIFSSERALHRALAQQIEASRKDVVTEADELAALFDQCLAAVAA